MPLPLLLKPLPMPLSCPVKNGMLDEAALEEVALDDLLGVGDVAPLGAAPADEVDVVTGVVGSGVVAGVVPGV